MTALGEVGRGKPDAENAVLVRPLVAIRQLYWPAGRLRTLFPTVWPGVPQPGSPPPALGFQLLPAPHLPDLHPPLHSLPGPTGTHISPPPGQPPFPGLFKAESSLHSSYIPVLPSRLGHSSTGREDPYRGGAGNSPPTESAGQSQVSRTGQAGLQRRRSVATKELLQPDGLLPEKPGLCEIYFSVKCTKF